MHAAANIGVCGVRCSPSPVPSHTHTHTYTHTHCWTWSAALPKEVQPHPSSVDLVGVEELIARSHGDPLIKFLQVAVLPLVVGFSSVSASQWS